MNPLGVSLANNLTIELNELANLPRFADFFQIIVSCGAQKFETKRIPRDSQRVQEVFQGRIEHGTENIHFKLIARESFKEETLGQQLVHISELQDQLKHDFSLVFNTRDGVDSVRLSVSIQWVFSKVFLEQFILKTLLKLSYYEQILEKLDQEIQNLASDRKDYELDLEWLLLPFKRSLTYHSRGPIILPNYTSNPLNIQVPDSLLYSQTKEGVFGATNRGDENFLKNSNVLKQQSEGKENQFSKHKREKTRKG